MKIGKKKYYIGERHNPQLPVYYVPEGQLSKKDAKKKENSLYGSSYMISFETEAEYLIAIEKLKNEGKKVH